MLRSSQSAVGACFEFVYAVLKVVVVVGAGNVLGVLVKWRPPWLKSCSGSVRLPAMWEVLVHKKKWGYATDYNICIPAHFKHCIFASLQGHNPQRPGSASNECWDTVSRYPQRLHYERSGLLWIAGKAKAVVTFTALWQIFIGISIGIYAIWNFVLGRNISPCRFRN